MKEIFASSTVCEQGGDEMEDESGVVRMDGMDISVCVVEKGERKGLRKYDDAGRNEIFPHHPRFSESVLSPYLDNLFI